MPIDKHYLPPKQSLWTGRHDSLDAERFFQTTTLIDLRHQSLPTLNKGMAIIGFACDEGVIRNLGRAGASQGPDAIREKLAALASMNTRPLLDLGTIQCLQGDLEKAQSALGVLIEHCHQHNLQTVILGGGHEMAYGHYLGLKTQYPKLGIINFDAHFDLRESEKPSSGTPFLQIAKDKARLAETFHYCCLGIQTTANTKSLFKTAAANKVSFLTAQDMQLMSLGEQLQFVDDFLAKQTNIYLSVCLDVFAEAYAPGVSAPQAMGLTPQHTLPLLRHIVQSGKVVSLDIAELSPPLDKAHQTAKLASALVAQLIELLQ